MIVKVNGVEFDDVLIAEFCGRYRVARLSLFGSILRDDFSAESDVDVLVEFLTGARPTLLSLGRMQEDLSDLVGRRVDLRTPMELSGYFRDRVVAGARLLHAA